MKVKPFSTGFIIEGGQGGQDAAMEAVPDEPRVRSNIAAADRTNKEKRCLNITKRCGGLFSQAVKGSVFSCSFKPAMA
jgi:hypothetical protein